MPEREHLLNAALLAEGRAARQQVLRTGARPPHGSLADVTTGLRGGFTRAANALLEQGLRWGL